VSDDVSVEMSGETVGEAKWAAVRELERLVRGLDRADVRFQVVSEGERGLLGVGQVPARVVATAPRGSSDAPPAAGGLSSEAELARELAERIVAALGARAAVAVADSATDVRVVISADDPGLLIGRHGQMIDSIQHVANTLAFREIGPQRKHVTVEIGGYRERRVSTLESAARRAAEQAVAEGAAQELEPMSSIDRRIVHECLKDDESVETSSVGSEPDRYVVVTPRHGSS
jgi:spoIIIJ-associated protein